MEWEAVFLLLSLSRSLGFKAQGSWFLLLSTTLSTLSTLTPCAFLGFICLAVLLSLAVCLDFLSASLSEPELSESDDFLSLFLFLLFLLSFSGRIPHGVSLLKLW